MSNMASRFVLWLIVAALLLFGQACNLRTRLVQGGPEAASTISLSRESSGPTQASGTAPTSTEAATGTPRAAKPTAASTTGTPALAMVRVTVKGGNLFIRRGPDLAFNPVGLLKDGDEVQALQRDVLGEWLEIPIPGKPGQTGWVSIQSRFSRVDGEVDNLPELDQMFWPQGASIRNCTYHVMQLMPGEIDIPPLVDFPDNEIAINPGFYTVRDMDVPGTPSVLELSILEGSQVDILKDANGDRHKCPED